MYRPEGTEKWYEQTKELLTNQGIIPPQTEYPIIISSEFEWEVLKRNCFEAGADAMLEGLKKHISAGHTDGTTKEYTVINFNKEAGTFVFIPEEK